jgi:hypothetical protein
MPDADPAEEPLLDLLPSDRTARELLGLYDLPAFARRGRDLEATLETVHSLCTRNRESRLEMVRLRLRQWTAQAARDGWVEVFAAPIEPLWCCVHESPPAYAAQSAPLARRLRCALELVQSVDRFNRQWLSFVDGLNLNPFNQSIELYNRYYTLEKECCLGSHRLALRAFQPVPLLTPARLLERYPALPRPALLPAHRHGDPKT